MIPSFSEAELIELAQYPREALDHANKMMTKMTSKGEVIKSPFKWFSTVCNNWVQQSQSKKNPETGTHTVHRPTEGPKALWKGYEARQEETDYEWSLKVEPQLHKFHLEKHPGLKYTRPIADTRFKKLTPEQQAYIMATVHQDCSCREAAIKPPLNPVRDKTSRTSWEYKALPVVDQLSTTEMNENIPNIDNLATVDMMFNEEYEEVF